MTESKTKLLTREQILNSRAAYPEGKDSGDPSGRMKAFHDALCDMALAYLDAAAFLEAAKWKWEHEHG